MRTNAPPVIKWNDYAALVNSLVRRMSTACPAADPEDLAAEGRLAFVEALSSWDPTQGKFSTHLYWQVRRRLKTWVRRETSHFRKVTRNTAETETHTELGEDGTVGAGTVHVVQRQGFLHNLMEHLGDDARHLVRVALEGAPFPLKQREAVRQVRRALRQLKYA